MNHSPKKEKPQLHVSHLNMLSRCGVQFERVHIMGHREPPGVAAVIGSSTHHATSENLRRKIQTGALMSSAEIKDIARDSFLTKWTETPVLLTDDERELGLDAVRGHGIDTAIELTVLHSEQLAPIVNPDADGVEWKWVIEAAGYPYDLAGEIDVKETDNIRELKTRTRAPNQNEADVSDQLTVYAMAKKIVEGKAPRLVHFDVLVKATKTIEARLFTFETVRDDQDFLVFKNRFERAIEIIEKGAFAPANRTDFWCSEKFCGFAANGSCPYFRGRVSFSFSNPQRQPQPLKTRNPKRKEDKHVNSNARWVPARTADWYDAVR